MAPDAPWTVDATARQIVEALEEIRDRAAGGGVRGYDHALADLVAIEVAARALLSRVRS